MSLTWLCHIWKRSSMNTAQHFILTGIRMQNSKSYHNTGSIMALIDSTVVTMSTNLQQTEFFFWPSDASARAFRRNSFVVTGSISFSNEYASAALSEYRREHGYWYRCIRPFRIFKLVDFQTIINWVPSQVSKSNLAQSGNFNEFHDWQVFIP